MRTKRSDITAPKGETSRYYVLQDNVISRASHDLSATALKIKAYAMSLLPYELDNLVINFTFADFCRATGYEAGGESYTLFIEAAQECMDSKISIDTSPLDKNKGIWASFSLFTGVIINKETRVVSIEFNPRLAELLKAFQRIYSKIYLHDLGRLQGRYSIHLFEIATTYSFLKGKQGNPCDTWYFEMTIEELRKIFSLQCDMYKETKQLKQKILDRALDEINKAGLGVELSVVSEKQGRIVFQYKFYCKTVPRLAVKKTKKQPSPVALPEIDPRIEQDRNEKENARLVAQYPEEYDALVKEYDEKHPKMQNFPDLLAQAAHGNACNVLKERHGIVK
jgi:plasmid replication initiation protein